MSGSGFKLRQGRKGLWYGYFPELEELGVRHGFSTRFGGCSEGVNRSLNLALHVEDEVEAVIENRRRFAESLGLEMKDLISVNQVHGDVVLVADEAERGRGVGDQSDVLGDADALVTIRRKLPLAMFFADCVPLLFFDRKKSVLALCHAGWKGTALDIAGKTLQKMRETYGSRAEDCLLAIGPSIARCCYQVSENVALKFEAQCRKREEFALQKYQLDLQLSNRIKALNAGVKAENIMESRVCTNCNHDLFFSYRADGGRTGRMGLFAELK